MEDIDIQAKLTNLEKGSKCVLHETYEALQAAGQNNFPLDFLVMGASKRSVQLISGFIELVQSKNVTSAGALLRMQIDTALRFAASSLVDDPHDFAIRVMAGEHIRKMKTRSGEAMTDSFLVTHFSGEAGYEWLVEVYEQTCGYVHFSEKHIFSTITSTEEEGRRVSFSIGAVDENVADEDLAEIIDAYEQAVMLYLKYLCGWTETKMRAFLDPEAYESARKGEEEERGQE